MRLTFITSKTETMTHPTFFDNAPIYTMHIKYGLIILCLGVALGSSLTGWLWRRWYIRKLKQEFARIKPITTVPGPIPSVEEIIAKTNVY